MTFEFRNDHIVTGYIKELLKDFNLPLFPVLKDDKPKILGRTYINGNYICKILKSSSGEIGPVNTREYRFGEKYLNGTKNLQIKTNYYDTYTHEYLGEYLRFIRDYKGINLMPLYNCFSDKKLTVLNHESLLNLELRVNLGRKDENGKTIYFDITPSDGKYIYYIVPVKFDEKYTISIDSRLPYEISLFFNNNTMGSEELDDLIKYSYKKVSGSSRNIPYLFNTDSTKIRKKYPGIWKLEKYLNLLIKLPSNNHSAITILEGSYLNNTRIGSLYPAPKIYGEFSFMDDKNLCPPTSLSLLGVLDKSYPFSDRLIEYLCGNAITPNETIPRNVGRVQQSMYNGDIFKGVYDYFDGKLERSIYTRMNLVAPQYNYGIEKVLSSTSYDSLEPNPKYSNRRYIDIYDDILYMIDKDVEKVVSL